MVPVVATPSIPGESRRAARKRRLAEKSGLTPNQNPSTSTSSSASASTSTPATLSGSSPTAVHVRACVQQPNWGQPLATIFDPFLIPSLPTSDISSKSSDDDNHFSWKDLRRALTDKQYIVLSSHALAKYEQMNKTDMNPPASKKHKGAAASSSSSSSSSPFSTTTVYDQLRQVVLNIIALGRKTESATTTTTTTTAKKTLPSAQGRKYWKSGTGYGGGNHMGSSDMTTTFAAQSQAHARQAKEDTTNQIILEEMLTGMSNVPESLLLHPVLSGALLKNKR